jgi:hypothetical protein
MTDELDKLTEIFMNGNDEEFLAYLKEHPPDPTHDCSSRWHVHCEECWIPNITFDNLSCFHHSHDEKHCKCRNCFNLEFRQALYNALTTDD